MAQSQTQLTAGHVVEYGVEHADQPALDRPGLAGPETGVRVGIGDPPLVEDQMSRGQVGQQAVVGDDPGRGNEADEGHKQADRSLGPGRRRRWSNHRVGALSTGTRRC